MKTAPIDDAFFQGRALLLVEDPLTRVVLVERWSGHSAAKHIQVRAVGGRAAVGALVSSSRAQGRTEVFGLTDRDFDGPGRGADGPHFRTPGHEMENHLIVPATLLRIAQRGVTVDEIHEKTLARAKTMRSWMALRRTLAEIRAALALTPPDPALHEITDVATAKDWLRSQKHPGQIEAALRRTWTDLYVAERVEKHDADCGDELANGRWAETFSGKELFRHLRASIAWRFPLANDDELAFLVARHWDDATTPPFISAMRDRIVAAFGRATS